MNDDMKIYCFYLVDNVIDPHKYLGVIADTIEKIGDKEYTLYAYTPEKDSAKFFRETRDMNKFVEKKFNMKRYEYEEFYDKYPYYALELHSFNTKQNKNDKYIAESEVMLATLQESDSVLFYNEEFITDFFENCLSYEIYDVLTKEVLDPEIMYLLDNFFIIKEMLSLIYPLEMKDYLQLETFKVDDISLFVKLFKNTLAINKEKDDEDVEILHKAQ